MREVRFVPPRVPIADPRTGLMTTQWYLFFQNFFDPQSSDELQSLLLSVPNANAIDLTAPLASALDGLAQVPVADTSPRDAGVGIAPPHVPTVLPDDVSPVLALLVAQIAELTKAVDDIRKGTTVL